jgi:hypothetical protein
VLWFRSARLCDSSTKHNADNYSAHPFLAVLLIRYGLASYPLSNEQLPVLDRQPPPKSLFMQVLTLWLLFVQVIPISSAQVHVLNFTNLTGKALALIAEVFVKAARFLLPVPPSIRGRSSHSLLTTPNFQSCPSQEWRVRRHHTATQVTSRKVS